MMEENLKRCHDLANEMAEQYALYARTDNDKKSIDDLIHVFKDYINDDLTIQIETVAFEQDPNQVVKGAMLRKGKTFEIYVVEDGHQKNRRFVTTKELFQTLLDDPEMWNMNLNAHVQELGAAELFGEKSSPAVNSERLAEIAAMQFLYPYENRVADIFRIKEGTCTYKQISDHYGLPQVYVETYLNEIVMNKLRPSHTLSLVKVAVAE